MANYTSLYKILGYQFKDENLLNLALSHRSVKVRSNERLEFLGDSILGFVVADLIYCRFPAMSEGKMSRLRSSLVNGETLATLALELKLNEYVLLGDGEKKNGGKQRPSILANCTEAIIAAIYLDSDLQTVRGCLLQWYDGIINTMDENVSVKDAKSQLQEWLQAKKLPLPEYCVVDVAGQSHCHTFTVSCEVVGLDIKTQAKASSRKRAEQLAANLFLEKLDDRIG